MKQVIKQLIEIGNKQLKDPKEKIQFTENDKWNKLLNDIENHSHLFVLGCVGDKQILASRAWGIPMLIGEQIGSFEFEDFDKLSRSDYKDLFEQNKFHRFNKDVGIEYYEAIKKIKQEYNSKANQLWKDGNSAQIFGRFLQFDGIGQKIASMAVNILVRHFKKDIKDLQWIDVSPDRHVIRVFKRCGIVRPEATKEEIIWKAKELNPEYPGVFDISTFKVGKNYCKSTNPNCKECILSSTCEKLIEADK